MTDFTKEKSDKTDYYSGEITKLFDYEFQIQTINAMMDLKTTTITTRIQRGPL